MLDHRRLPRTMHRLVHLLAVMGEAVASSRAHRLRSTLAALAVAAAVATIAVVLTGLDGLQRYARVTSARAFGSETFVIARVVSGTLSRRELARRQERNPRVRASDLRFLERYGGDVVAYAPTIQRSADVVAGGRRYENAAVTGTSSALFQIRDLEIAQGRFLRRDDDRRATLVAVIGADIADELFPGLDPLGRTIRVGGRGLEVVGLQARQGSAGGVSLDRYLWIPLGAFERVFGPADTLQVFGRGPSIESAEDRARATMRARRRLRPGADDNFDVLAPEAARGFVLRLTERVGAAATPISLMALLAAMVVVTNTSLVSVVQRTREIGVRRAVGASRAQIALEVLTESTLVALGGGAIGLVAAAAVVRIAAAAFDVDLTLGVGAVVSSLGAAGASGILSGWYPARKASRIDVITALRME